MLSGGAGQGSTPRENDYPTVRLDPAPEMAEKDRGAKPLQSGDRRMRYLVTGGAGFIGSHIVETLLDQGHEVRVLDDLSTGHRRNLDPVLGAIDLVVGSVADLSVCRRAMCGVDFVLHQAALPSVPRSIRNPIATHEVCATGTLNILVAAKDEGVRRVVYASSSSAYGNTPELPKREDMPPRPRSPYAVAKFAGEAYCRAFRESYGLETVMLRYFNVFGPRQDPHSEYSAVIPKFIQLALEGLPPTIHGDGEQTRDFTYVENVVQANLLACEASSSALGQVTNVGCGERISLNSLWDAICSIVGRRVEPIFGPEREGDVRDSLSSLDRARAWLGYQPVVGLNEGLERTISHFLADREAAAAG